MRKLKLLFAGFALLGGLSANAQTDVTSTYLTNADFEGEYSVYSYPRDDGGNARAIYQPNGWTISYTNGESNDITALDGDCLQWSNFSGRAQPASGDSKTYWIRFRWGNSENLTLSQTVILPAGAYNYSADAFFNGASSGSASISAAGKSTNITGNSTWGNYEINFTLASETSVTFAFNLTQGSAVENIAGFDNFKLTYKAIVVKDVLEKALTAATVANASLGTLTSAISTAQAVYDNGEATQEEVNAAAATLNAATESAMSDAGDVTGIFLSNPGFESCTVTETNAAAAGSAAPLDISGNWTQVSSAEWSSSAVVAYGGSGQVNGVSAPANDNAGNSGNAFGVSVGWDGLVTYQSDAVTLPAGVYTLKVYAFNANSGASQFTSKFGFVPTEGAASLSTKTSFTYNSWETDQVTFTLNEATEGKIQIGGKAVSGGSGSNAKVFLDNITITYSNFLAGAKAAWDDALAAAKAAVKDEAYENVTGSELTNLNTEIVKDEPTTVDGYNDAAAALNTATSTFTAAKAAYDGLANLWSTGVPELIYATTKKYTAIGDAYFGEGDVVDAADASARTAAMIIAIRAYYESHAMAEKVAGAVDMTSSIANATEPANNDGWSWTGNKNNPASNEPWTDAAGNSTHSYFDGGNWNGSNWTTTMKQTISLPAGKYLLTAKGRAATNTTLTMAVGTANVELPHVGNAGNVFNNGWGDGSIEFTTDGSDVEITVTATAEPTHEWFSISDFRLVQLEAYANMTIGDAKYATFVAPFDVAIPSDVTAYTVGGIDANGYTLVMTPVATTIPANTPVVVYSKSDVNKDFTGATVSGTPKVGLLTGTYTTIKATDGQYVLQNQGGKVAFYQVDTSEATPNVPANRAYLEVPSTARALYFDAATAIKTIEALTSGEAEIYGANGARQNGLKKGVNIIKRGDKTMKVMVK